MFHLFLILATITFVFPGHTLSFLDAPISKIQSTGVVDSSGTFVKSINESRWTWRQVLSLAFLGLALVFALFHKEHEVA